MKAGCSLVLATLFAISLTTPISAHASIDDSDLSPRPRILDREEVPLSLPLDQVQRSEASSGVAFEFLRQDHGKLTAVEGLTVSILKKRNEKTESRTSDSRGLARFESCGKGGETLRLKISLENAKFAVTNGDKSYYLEWSADCGSHVTFTFNEDSHAGQALGIWQVAHRGQKRLEASVGLAFWKSSLQFVWPANGDYYMGGTVHLTRGDHWDVVGHEMGHAIYDFGRLGGFGGGPHKIDECYSDALALSEGWASYFSAWVSVDLADADARFEHMVPRRAPIRFENVPEDVCKGPTNEWRVTSFFWDLIDHHDDGEKVQDSFARVWRALEGTRTGSATEALPRLEKAGIQKEWLDLVWDLNFK